MCALPATGNETLVTSLETATLPNRSLFAAGTGRQNATDLLPVLQKTPIAPPHAPAVEDVGRVSNVPENTGLFQGFFLGNAERFLRDFLGIVNHQRPWHKQGGLGNKLQRYIS